jgi:hypothetical protein
MNHYENDVFPTQNLVKKWGSRQPRAVKASQNLTRGVSLLRCVTRDVSQLNRKLHEQVKKIREWPVREPLRDLALGQTKPAKFQKA